MASRMLWSLMVNPSSAVYHAAGGSRGGCRADVGGSTMRRGQHDETDQCFDGNDVGADRGIFAGRASWERGARFGNDSDGLGGKHRGRGKRVQTDDASAAKYRERAETNGRFAE